MVARKGKSMMQLVRLPILRLLLLKRENFMKSSKNLKDLYICMAGWQGLPPSHTNPSNFSNFQSTIK